MKKLLSILLITLAFMLSGCYTVFMYDGPTGYIKYEKTILIVEPYHTYINYAYPYSYYWHNQSYYHQYKHKNIRINKIRPNRSNEIIHLRNRNR